VSSDALGLIVGCRLPGTCFDQLDELPVSEFKDKSPVLAYFWMWFQTAFLEGGRDVVERVQFLMSDAVICPEVIYLDE